MTDDTPAQRGRPARALPATRRRWVAAAGALVVAAAGGIALLAGRDPAPAAATVFRVPGQPTGVVVDGGRVWVAGPAAGEVWVLDGRSGRVAQPALRVGGAPARLALDPRFAWIADTERGAVMRARRDGSGAPRPLRGGPDVADVAVAAGAVWTASSADGTIRVIGPAGRRQVLHVGARPVALAADARRVVAADAAGALVRLRRALAPPGRAGRVRRRGAERRRAQRRPRLDRRHARRHGARRRARRPASPARRSPSAARRSRSPPTAAASTSCAAATARSSNSTPAPAPSARAGASRTPPPPWPSIRGTSGSPRETTR